MDVTIKRGQVKIDVIGGHGSSCEDFTKAYENRLAEGSVERHFKPEHDVPDEVHRLRETGG